MAKIGIVAIGYNRIDSLKRLLESLNRAYYPTSDIELIISIDNSGKDDVVNFSKSFEWKYGKKTVVTYPERQGLRKHILHCGDFVESFDAIVVLEDDLVVSPSFYTYAQSVCDKYIDNQDLAGFSLYN